MYKIAGNTMCARAVLPVILATLQAMCPSKMASYLRASTPGWVLAHTLWITMACPCTWDCCPSTPYCRGCTFQCSSHLLSFYGTMQCTLHVGVSHASEQCQSHLGFTEWKQSAWLMLREDMDLPCGVTLSTKQKHQKTSSHRHMQAIFKMSTWKCKCMHVFSWLVGALPCCMKWWYLVIFWQVEMQLRQAFSDARARLLSSALAKATHDGLSVEPCSSTSGMMCLFMLVCSWLLKPLVSTLNQKFPSSCLLAPSFVGGCKAIVMQSQQHQVQGSCIKEKTHKITQELCTCNHAMWVNMQVRPRKTNSGNHIDIHWLFLWLCMYVYVFLFSGTKVCFGLFWDSSSFWFWIIFKDGQPTGAWFMRKGLKTLCVCVHDVLYIDSHVSWGVIGFEEIWVGKFQEVSVPVTMIMYIYVYLNIFMYFYLYLCIFMYIFWIFMYMYICLCIFTYIYVWSVSFMIRCCKVCTNVIRITVGCCWFLYSHQLCTMTCNSLSWNIL